MSTDASEARARKPHFLVVDGLRGVAAILIVICHFERVSHAIMAPNAVLLPHMYLAVDFFSVVSGFVLAYAYDDRWDRMNAGGFLKSRLVRLHPMMVMGVLIGLASYLLDPFAGSYPHAPFLQPQDATPAQLGTAVLGGVLSIPTPPLPNRFGALFSLNAPAWSMMWEYVATLVYAFVLWRLPRPALIGVVLVAAAGLIFAAIQYGTLVGGAGWGQGLIGFARVSFSFCMGLLVYRSGIQVKSRVNLPILAALLVLCFYLPGYGNPESGTVPYNWIYDCAVIIFVLPAIVIFGAGAEVSGWLKRLCVFSGRISYPLYVLHYALVMPFANYFWSRGVAPAALPWVILGLTASVVLLSHLVLVFYDEPVRQLLTRRFLKRREVPGQPVGAIAARITE